MYALLPSVNEVWGKVMFFKPVCHSVHRGQSAFPQCHGAGRPLPPPPTPPRGWTPGLGVDPSTGRLPAVGRTPMGGPGIRSTSGRYASYWNASLFQLKFH